MGYIKKFESYNQKNENVEGNINEGNSTNYYTNELKGIKTDGEYYPTFQVKNGEGEYKTKWMDLNDDSAKVLYDWLKNKFNL